MLIERLSAQTGRSVDHLVDFARTAGIKYKVFEIPKRSGKGNRLIEQPSKSVKALQRWLVRSLFAKYPVHSSAMGYKANTSITDNAREHKKFKYTLRMDFKNFFWSFESNDIHRFFGEKSLEDFTLSKQDIDFVVGIVCRHGRLVMGAPSSPMLTNIMMYDLDSEITTISDNFEVKYTRYADDLFFSTNAPGHLALIRARILECIRTSGIKKLHINEAKTLFLSKKFHREITGLVITTEGEMSIGRIRKRMIKSLSHKAINDQLDEADLAKLAGYLNWAASVEPTFFDSLCTKYEKSKILQLRNPRKN